MISGQSQVPRKGENSTSLSQAASHDSPHMTREKNTRESPTLDEEEKNLLYTY